MAKAKNGNLRVASASLSACASVSQQWCPHWPADTIQLSPGTHTLLVAMMNRNILRIK